MTNSAWYMHELAMTYGLTVLPIVLCFAWSCDTLMRGLYSWADKFVIRHYLPTYGGAVVDVSYNIDRLDEWCTIHRYQSIGYSMIYIDERGPLMYGVRHICQTQL